MAMFLRRLCYFFVLLACPLFLRAQDESKKEESIHPQPEAQPGTYQFIVSPNDTQFVFTRDVLTRFEKLRSENQEIYYRLNDSVEVRIIPRSEIRKPDFVPVREIIYRVSKPDEITK